MPNLFVLLFILIFSPIEQANSIESKEDENSFKFSGRISRLNSGAKLARIRTDFANIKFLNRNDKVEFWNETYPNQKCVALIAGRTNDYLLLKIPEYETCIKRVHFTTGTYLFFRSKDLQQTTQIAKELVEILLKKRLAMNSKKERHQRELNTHNDKVEAVNKRFEILKEKLQIEWQRELALLEEDKANSFLEFKNSEARVNEIDAKIEMYRVQDHNLKIDRWSLDPALYIEK